MNMPGKALAAPFDQEVFNRWFDQRLEQKLAEKVLHRFLAFGASNAVLIALWVMAGLALHAGAARVS